MWSEHRFLSFDGKAMLYRRLDAPQPRAVVLIVHGMGEHGGRYVELAQYLAGRGFTCYLPDLRGFGKSGGGRGCVHRFKDYFHDLESVCRAIHSREGSLRIFFLGHSFGGLVVAHFLAEHRESHAKGMVLSSPNFGIAVHVPPWRHFLGHAASAFFPNFAQSNRVDPASLTHDPVQLERHESDPLVHDRISARLYTELMLRIASAQESAQKITLPVLILQAGDDRVVSSETTKRYYEVLASPDKTLHVLEGLYHEILNETSRQAIYCQIADWLSRRA